jgi:NAD(P)-dependent dehydrogenase (short-subunit alcohol dehydrogenase family)
MTARLAGKIAAVTGAASGIGRAAARAFAAEGARLALIDRHEDGVRELAHALGPGHLALCADVTVESQVAAAFATMLAAFGRLDVLYNCAAIELFGADAPVDHLDLDVWRKTLEANLTGVFLCCKHGVGLMLRTRSGSIINCGSPTAISGRGARHHAYSASKGGVHALTRAMAASYGAFGIRVNCIVPGATRTAMTAELFQDSEAVAQLSARSALGRLGEPEDLAGIAVFLASDESSLATGSTFVVDGGIHIT